MGTWFTVFHVSCTTYSYLTFFIIFSDQARGVSAGGVAGGVAATAILVLCCIVFVAVYLHKRKQPAPNVDKTRYGLIGLVSSQPGAIYKNVAHISVLQWCCL